MHVRRKRMRARLISDDPELQTIRRVTVRVGDEVEVIRGDFGHPNSAKSDTRGKRLGQSRGRAGVSGKIAKVDTNSGMIFIDGVTITTSDGKEEAIPIHPSNVIVTKLFEGDTLRLKRLLERTGGEME
jgi:large subunit ribosomal protein L24